MTIKLTKAQRGWLELVNASPWGMKLCVPGYKTHVALAQLGFVEQRPTRAFGYINSAITPAGLEWLKAHPRKQ